MAHLPAGPVPVPGAGRRLRLALVQDSTLLRRELRRALEADGVAVVGEARTGREATALLRRITADVVLVNLDLPPGRGVALVHRLVQAGAPPVVGYTLTASDGGRRPAADLPAPVADAALRAGAVDVVCGPAGPPGPGRASVRQLHRRLSLAAGRPVPPEERTGAGQPARQLPPVAGARPVATARGPAGAGPADRPPRLVVVGASTGGPHAVLAVLQELGAASPPVVVVQHMANGFMDGLADWLAQRLALTVRIGRDGLVLAPGTLTLAPADRNLLVDAGLRVRTNPPEPGQHHLPGIDATFRAAAEAVGAAAVGVLLTGMGRDGAVGLRALRDRGARTIAQDQTTCVVYGMPAAAVALGAAERVLPLPDIGPLLAGLVQHGPPAADGTGRAGCHPARLTHRGTAVAR